MKTIQSVLIGATLIIVIFGIYNHFLITGMQTFDSAGLSISQCQDGSATLSEGGATCGLGGVNTQDFTKTTVGGPWDLPKIGKGTPYKCAYYCVVEASYSQRGECYGNRWIRVYPEDIIGVLSSEFSPEGQIEEGVLLDSWKCKVPATRNKVLPKANVNACKVSQRQLIDECKKAFTKAEIDEVSRLAKTRTETCVKNNQDRCNKPTQKAVMLDPLPVGPELDFGLSRIIR